ncbi:MAG: HEPN domain-containing protein [Planctomycetes bacterium]|nr:HEPN domain-containing protein [Planctomycetota bacterium]
MTLPFDEPEYDRWFRTAERTPAEAEFFAKQDLHHWAAFVGRQAAEAALKAPLRGLGKPVVTDSMKQLLDTLESPRISVGTAKRHAARILERHCKGTRHPDQYPAGTPRDQYDGQIAREALDAARAMLARNHPTAYWAAREGVVIRDGGLWASFVAGSLGPISGSPAPD